MVRETALCISPPELFAFNFSSLPLIRQLHTRNDADHGSHQRGLCRFSNPLTASWRGWLRDCLFMGRGLRRFLSFCVFCILQCRASRSLPARRLAASAVAGRAPQAASVRSERAYIVSSQALLRSALCCFRAEAGGASFASLRRAGLRLARLNAGVYLCKPQPPEHLFSLPTHVAASCIFQSAAELVNNSIVCHSEEQSDEESVC